MSEPPPPAWRIDFPDGVVMPFQRVEPESFRMGSRGEYADEEPIHTVQITHGFYLGTYPVTQAQFELWTRATGITHENGFPNKHNHPANPLISP